MQKSHWYLVNPRDVALNAEEEEEDQNVIGKMSLWGNKERHRQGQQVVISY